MPSVVVSAAGAHANYLVPPMTFSQVSLVMEGAAQANWMHILLCRVEGSRWVTLDPEGGLSVDDLAQEEVTPLVVGSPIPLVCRPCLCFLGISEMELADAHVRARQLAEMLGALAAPAALGGGSAAVAVWVFADTAYADLGKEVPPTVLGAPNGARLEPPAGLVQVDGAWTLVQRIMPSDLDLWVVEKREGAGRDRRLSFLHRGSASARPLFRDAQLHFDREDVADVSLFSGSATVDAVVSAIVSSSCEPKEYILRHIEHCGLAKGSGLGKNCNTPCTLCG